MLPKFSSREKKQLSSIGLLLLLLLLFWLVFAPNRGLVSLYQAKKEITKLQTENIKLAEENKTLQDEIKKLQDNPAYLEEKARKEYGMLKENEVLYIFKKKQ
jgi:cell division protein FtsB